MWTQQSPKTKSTIVVVTKGDKGELVKAWANPVDSKEPLVAEAYAIYRPLTVSL